MMFDNKNIDMNKKPESKMTEKLEEQKTCSVGQRQE